MAELVDEDEQPETDDRDEDRHTRRRASGRRARRASRVGRDEIVEIARRRAVDLARASSATVSAISGNADPPVEERRHRDLVRGVVRARVGPPALARGPRQGKQRERLGIGRLERELEPGGEIERLGRHRGALAGS